MPLARISVPRQRSSATAGDLRRIHAALQEAFNVPARRPVSPGAEHDPNSGLIRSASYLGIEYSDDLTIIQITVSDTRTLEQKKRCSGCIARSLAAKPGLRTQRRLRST